MRSKHIAALITFFVTFAFSSFIALLFAAPKVYDVPPVVTYEVRNAPKAYSNCMGNKIKDFLLQDKRYGLERRNDQFSDDDSLPRTEAEAIRIYADKSGSMDASHLPRDFRAAWNEHMRAWDKYADFMQRVKNRNADSDAFDERQSSYIDEINTTWAETLRIGRSYGADLPEGF